ncbi:MAG: Gfo/Idh/MocA family oxidoreductase [Gemmataceae bacterium]
MIALDMIEAVTYHGLLIPGEISMPSSRRGFLQSAGVASALSLSAQSYAQVAGANERIALGLIGPGGMGTAHLRTLLTQKDVRIAAVCDVDRDRLAAAAKSAAEEGREPQATSDLRRVVENRDISAVLIATPDHWHTPAALLALDAGKHVYVEKPVSHNIREGRLLIDAVRRTGKVLQVGTQSRSTEPIRAAIRLLREGAIGEILSVRVWNSQLRRNIGKVRPSDPPAVLDYETWVGPAPMTPYRTNLLPGSWRWFHAFGCGDMGNDGVHDLDIARWGLGVDAHPQRITALGGKYFFDDDQEFPDTQTVVFEWDNIGTPARTRQMIFEMRIWTPYKMEGYENGVAFYGTTGMMLLGKEAGWKIFGPRNVERQTGACRPDLAAHHRNFFESIRNSRTPNADATTGHLSAALCHLGNIAVRLGRTLRFDPRAEEFANDKDAQALVSREYRNHWGRPRGA